MAAKIFQNLWSKIDAKKWFYRRFYKLPHKFHFSGGFAVDADFGDGFSGSIEGPKIMKIGKFR
jgi:hypothetical protein